MSACRWTVRNDKSWWNTGCGESWFTGDELTPQEAGLKFCPMCGGKVETRRTLQTLMYSEKMGILCEVKSNGKYWILNGHWYGTRDGKKFTIDFTGDVFEVDDWQELTRDEFTELYPNFGY